MPAVSPTYMDGRIKYARPEAVLFSENPGTLEPDWKVTGLNAVITSGSYEVQLSENGGSTVGLVPGYVLLKTSGNGAFGTSVKVVEVTGPKTFTVNVAHSESSTTSITFNAGSYVFLPGGTEFSDFIFLTDHNRDGLNFSPERIEKRERMINGRMRSYHIADKLKLSVSWKNLPSRAFPLPGTINPTTGKSSTTPYTIDGGAGGNELLDWYESHTGSFWVFLSYDKYKNFGDDRAAYGHLGQYSQVVEMYIADFSYTVDKRGGSNYDMWNVSVTLEEA
jgi:hypothetical protein